VSPRAIVESSVCGRVIVSEGSMHVSPLITTSVSLSDSLIVDDCSEFSIIVALPSVIVVGYGTEIGNGVVSESTIILEGPEMMLGLLD
jgi:hypothetical protein